MQVYTIRRDYEVRTHGKWNAASAWIAMSGCRWFHWRKVEKTVPSNFFAATRWQGLNVKMHTPRTDLFRANVGMQMPAWRLISGRMIALSYQWSFSAIRLQYFISPPACAHLPVLIYLFTNRRCRYGRIRCIWWVETIMLKWVSSQANDVLYKFYSFIEIHGQHDSIRTLYAHSHNQIISGWEQVAGTPPTQTLGCQMDLSYYPYDLW